MNGAVILAAGASTRFGSPKALVQVAGESAVSRICRILSEAGCRPIQVVLGAHADELRAHIPPTATVTLNPDWRRGRTGSLKAGLHALPPSANAVVWPVDHPAASAETLGKLLAAPGAIRLPVHARRRGHPVLFEASLRKELLALGDDQPLHDLVHDRPSRVQEVPVEDEGIHINIDVPDDVTKLQHHFRRIRRARPVA